MGFFEHRTTGDILVLMVAGTVCASVLLGGATVAVVLIVNPDADTSTATGIIADVINTLIGLLAGFMAGRTDVNVRKQTQVDDDLVGSSPPRSKSIADET